MVSVKDVLPFQGVAFMERILAGGVATGYVC